MSRWGRLPHVSPEILDAMGKPELKQPRTVRVAREQGSSKRVTVRAAISVLLPREKRHQHLNITEKPGSVTYLGGREGCEPDAELREWLATRVGPTALTRSFRWGTLNMAEADLRGLLEWEWGWEIRNREGETKR